MGNVRLCERVIAASRGAGTELKGRTSGVGRCCRKRLENVAE